MVESFKAYGRCTLDLNLFDLHCLHFAFLEKVEAYWGMYMCINAFVSGVFGTSELGFLYISQLCSVREMYF